MDATISTHKHPRAGETATALDVPRGVWQATQHGTAKPTVTHIPSGRTVGCHFTDAADAIVLARELGERWPSFGADFKRGIGIRKARAAEAVAFHAIGLHLKAYRARIGLNGWTF